MKYRYPRPGVRAQQQDLARSLRTEGKSWPQVADALRHEYGLNALIAIRLAHGLTQTAVAELWTRRWPDDSKTLKNISYWENWPGPYSRQPSLLVLDHLAEIYQCAIADLVAGLGDYSHTDEIVAAQPISSASQC